jgi:Ca2+-transporting ATPase
LSKNLTAIPGRDGFTLIIIVAVNVMIGFYQEWKSENILASLKNLVANKCNVR